MNKVKIIAFPVLSGILYALSFPKPGLYFLAWVALVPLLLVLPGFRARYAALPGLVAGFTGSLGLVYWIYPTIYAATLSSVQSLICLALLAGYLALYVALWTMAVRFVWAKTSVLRFSLFGAALWVAVEFLRSKMLNGFTWGYIGYSQADFTSLIQLASYGGVFLISFLVVMTNIAIAQLIMTRRVRPFAMVMLIVALAVACGNGILRDSIRRYRPDINVAGLQGNIDQYKKFDDAYKNEIMAVYTSLAREAAKERPDIIVWPETSVPGLLPDDTVLLRWISAVAQETKSFHLFGAACSGGKGEVYNAAILVAPDGKIAGIHRKTHLVIFGEYVPLRKLFERYFGVLNTIGDLVPGQTQSVLTAGAVQCGPTICSENFFGDLVRRFALNGANVLANQTNDAWYGKTSQQAQHFQMSILRAVENRRAIVVAANTGVSGIISPAGVTSSVIALDTPGYFTGKAAAVNFVTFYTVHGDLFAGACAAVSLVVVLLTLLAKRIVRLRGWSGKLFGGTLLPQ